MPGVWTEKEREREETEKEREREPCQSAMTTVTWFDCMTSLSQSPDLNTIEHSVGGRWRVTHAK